MPSADPSAPEPPVDLSVQQVRTLCAVRDLGSYAAAGRRYGLSTSAVWEQVRHLERQYSTRLFERQGRQVVPTAAGVRLVELLRPLLAGIESTREVLRQEGGARPVSITLATGVRMLIEELGGGLREFRERCPEVRLRLLQSDSRDAELLVVEGEADVAMTLQPGPDHLGEEVTAEAAYEIDYLLVAPPRHPLGRRRALRLRDLAEHPLVLPHEGTYSRHLIRETFHRHGLTDRIEVACETANSAFTVACVRAGLGVGIIAGQREGPLCHGLTVRSLARWLGQARIVFLRRRGARLPPVARDLVDAIQRALPGRGRAGRGRAGRGRAGRG